MKKRIIISLVLLSSFYPKSPPKIHKKKVKKKKENRPTKILNPTYTNPKRLGKFVFFLAAVWNSLSSSTFGTHGDEGVRLLFSSLLRKRQGAEKEEEEEEEEERCRARRPTGSGIKRTTAGNTSRNTPCTK